MTSLDLFTTTFNLAYLAIIWAMAVLMGWRYLHHSPAQRRVSRWLLYAVLMLGVGDLFHLVARAFRTFTYRNIPFTLAGLGLAYLLLRAAPTVPNPTGKLLAGIGWAVIVSFTCYLGTILLVERYPMTGMLMLPKTIAYVVVAVYFYKLEFRPILSRQEI